MLSLFVQRRDIEHKPYIPPPWVRRVESALMVVSMLSFLPAWGLLAMGVVRGNPVREALSRVGASYLIPVAGRVEEALAPWKIVGGLIRMRHPQFSTWLTSIPGPTIAHIFLASVGMGVASFGVVFLIVLLIVQRENRTAWQDVVCW
jgi:hypothetical protein